VQTSAVAYEQLGVATTATADEVHAAYRALARRFHPDGAEPDAVRMTAINAAYDELKTPERRRRYDRERRLVPVGPGRSAGAGAMDPSVLGPLRRRVAAAHADDPVLDFGPYAGWQIHGLARFDPDYLRWLSRHSMGVRFGRAIAQSMPNDREVGRRGACVR
jgi:curved DNA-binding protein CbpA